MNSCWLKHHESHTKHLYVALAQTVRDRAIKNGIHDVGDMVTAHRNSGTLSKTVPLTRLHRNKFNKDGLYHYDLYHLVQDIRFVIPFSVIFKKEAKEIAEALKKLCGIVYYDYYGTFYGHDLDELLLRRS